MDKKVRAGIEGWLLLLIVGLWSQLLTAQSASPKKDIPAIAKAANGAIASIVMSDKDGKPLAQGSGFLVSKDGLIVTNYHVIAQGSSAVVKLPDGAFYLVDGVLASDKVRDVAVIKAHGENFRTLILGNSDQLQVGEEVVAIGNPLSLESTVSNGIISGIRTAEKLGGKFLQTTAPISPGSSGGPLFNMLGEVIGINTMYLEGGENLNFAIPINDAKRLLMAQFSKVRNLPNEPEPAETPKETSTPQASLEQQKLCSEQAEKVFNDYLHALFLYEREWNLPDPLLADHTSRYDASQNICYAGVSSFQPLTASGSVIDIRITDAFSNSRYGGYRHHTNSDGSEGKTECWIKPARRSRISCTYVTEFDDLAMRYFGISP
jgi:hypothetical protein